jgi:hypothetical protein
VFEPHSFAVLSGGAEDGVAGYLDLTWHGAHDEGQGRGRDLYVSVDVVRASRDGAFELYFCSTRCLRRFLAACVDRLEERMKRQAAEYAAARRKTRTARAQR